MKSDANVYTGSLPTFPGFTEGTALALQAAGAADIPAFTLRGWGIAPVTVPKEPLPAEDGKPLTVTWTPPGKMGPQRVLLNVGLNLHGSVDTWMVCDVPDTGSFTIDAALVGQLFKFGTSGFPRISVTRLSADSTTVKNGCVQFSVASEVERPLKVPGLESCNFDEECAMGKKCQQDRQCK
jgi:hypothetical protein